jgi:hypothetical protein
MAAVSSSRHDLRGVYADNQIKERWSTGEVRWPWLALALAQGLTLPAVIWLSVGKSFLALLHLGYLLHHLPFPETEVLVLKDVVMMELPICL